MGSNRLKNLLTPFFFLAIAFVIRIVDGDTVDVVWDNGIEDCIRLIGIDAPEKGEEGWKEASDFLEGTTLNRIVWVEKDEETRDHYNRYLGYIWVDGEMVNLILVEEGFAVPLEYPPNTKYARVFEEAYKR